ncbi:MAG: molybdenum cofactor biosynthesis protein MoaE [Burkholderiaceae bacterium]
MSQVKIQKLPFDLHAELDFFHASDARVGAICSFMGTVRDRSDGRAINSLELEHYPGMTEKSIESMIHQANQRFNIYSALVIHRIGILKPLEPIVLVAVSSAHRHDSFQACEFIMDYLKTQAPFWKKEGFETDARWVDARDSDDKALARWGIDSTNAVKNL